MQTVLQFTKGQYVYIKRLERAEALGVKARAEIYRVREVRPSGVLVLEGSDLRYSFTENAVNCSPCHLAIAPLQVEAQAFRPPTDFYCEICSLAGAPNQLLICDSCARGFHTFCLHMSSVIPKGVWACPQCHAAGVKLDTLRTLRAEIIGDLEEKPPKGSILKGGRNVFTVEALLGHFPLDTPPPRVGRRGRGGRGIQPAPRPTSGLPFWKLFEYYVKWAGHSEDANSWVPGWNVTEDVLEAYWGGNPQLLVKDL